MRWIITASIAVLAGCPNRQNVPCNADTNCDLAAGGVCVAGPSEQWCAYPDSNCPGGYRFSDFDVGDGVSGQCVGGNTNVDAPLACQQLIAFHRTDGLYIVKPDGMGIDGRASGQTEENAVWSPDGTRILFERGGIDAKDIFAVNADGTGITNLTQGAAGDDYKPAWSPDGKYIAFVSERNYTGGSGQDVFVMEADGRNPMLVDVKADAPTWSPDSTKLAYGTFKSGRFQIHVANRDGTNSVNITMSNFPDNGPRWSPDGSKILFETVRGSFGSAIFIMNPDGSGQTALAPSLQVNAHPAWSPNGARIAFNGATTINDDTDVYLINADRSGLVNITPGIVPEDKDASWSPDGKQLVIATKRDNTNNELYRINDDATGPLRLTTSDFFSEAAPAWAPCK
ncbi:MAG TPA: hypothetical protein VFQ53_04695 [Kofleriaceae bacterium]|nr:hypothetical protein [Kofleriaceae bacterium]